MMPGTYLNGFAPRDSEPLFPSLWNGCAGAWSPCLGPTGLSLRDWSQYHNHGTLTNMVASSDWVINEKYSIDFDGTDDHVLVPTAPHLDFVSQVTMACWARVNTGTTTSGYLLTKRDGGEAAWGMFIQATAGVPDRVTLFGEAIGGITTLLSSTAASITVGRWHHICSSINGTVGEIWIDGVLNTTGTVSAIVAKSTIPVVIGARGNTLPAVSAVHNGQIDDCRIYNRSLTANEKILLSRRRGISYEMYSPRVSRFADVVSGAARIRRILMGMP